MTVLSCAKALLCPNAFEKTTAGFQGCWRQLYRVTPAWLFSSSLVNGWQVWHLGRLCDGEIGRQLVLHSFATVGLCMEVFWNITMKSLHFSVMWLINKCVSVHHAGWTAWKGFIRFIQLLAYTKCWRLLASQRQVKQLGWMTLKEMHAWFICVWTQQ